MTYTPPPRKNRRKGYENNVKHTPEVQESNYRTSEMGFQTDEELPQLKPALQPTTDADEDIPSCRDEKEKLVGVRQVKCSLAADAQESTLLYLQV